jgi:hypothetical protein
MTNLLTSKSTDGPVSTETSVHGAKNLCTHVSAYCAENSGILESWFCPGWLIINWLPRLSYDNDMTNFAVYKDEYSKKYALDKIRSIKIKKINANYFTSFYKRNRNVYFGYMQ